MPYNNSLNYNKTPFNINPTSNPQGNPQENPENKNQTNPTTQTSATPNYVNMGVNMYHPGYYNQGIFKLFYFSFCAWNDSLLLLRRRHETELPTLLDVPSVWLPPCLCEKQLPSTSKEEQVN